MTKKNSLFTPIIVLVCIGLVASFLLAGVFQVTKPIIDQREAETKNNALKLVLPDGSGFDKVEGAELVTGVYEVYKASNGAGFVFSTNCKSQQGGTIDMMIGVDAAGAVKGISVISHSETAGIGDKVLQDSYFQTYYGLNTVDAVNAADVVSGATKTSNCVKESAAVALAEFAIVNK